MSAPWTLFDEPGTHPLDASRVQASHRALLRHADGLWRSKALLARLADCSEHALSARLSELRRMPGVTVERQKVKDDGALHGRYEYRILRGAA